MTFAGSCSAHRTSDDHLCKLLNSGVKPAVWCASLSDCLGGQRGRLVLPARRP